MTTNDPADVLAMRERLLENITGEWDCDPYGEYEAAHKRLSNDLDALIAATEQRARGQGSGVVEAARLVSQWADAVDPMPDELRAELRDLRRYFEEETTPALTARCGYVYPDASLCDEPDHAPLVSHDFQPTPALTAERCHHTDAEATSAGTPTESEE